MGKCGVRSCGEQRNRSPSSSSSTAAAVAGAVTAGYLTLRSGRRVPAVAAASCSPTRSRRQQQCRGGSGRRCGGAKSARGSPRRKQSAAAAGVRQCCRVVTSQLVLPGGQPEQEAPAPAPAKTSDPIVRDGRCDVGDSRRDTLLISGEAEALKKRHQCEANRGVAADRSPPPPSEAEMEPFFAAAELAERRRFAKTYNYDVALDRPLDGRFEWAPVST